MYKRIKFKKLFALVLLLCLAFISHGQAVPASLKAKTLEAQTVFKLKTISITDILPQGALSMAGNKVLPTKSYLDTFMAHKALNENFTGQKTFSDTPILNNVPIRILTVDNTNVSLIDTKVTGVTFPWFRINGGVSGSKIIMGANSSASAADEMRLVADYTDTLWTGTYRPLIIDAYDYMKLRGNRSGIGDTSIAFMSGSSLYNISARIDLAGNFIMHKMAKYQSDLSGSYTARSIPDVGYINTRFAALTKDTTGLNDTTVAKINYGPSRDTFVIKPQLPNKFWASDPSGSSLGYIQARGIVAADIPLLPATKISGLSQRVVSSNTKVSFTGSTAETTIATYTIPAGSIGTNGSYHIHMIDSMTANTNGKTMKIKFNGTTVGTLSVSSATASSLLQTVIFNCNSLTAQVGGPGNSSVGLGNPGSGISRFTFNTAADITVTITITLNVGTDTFSIEAFEVLAFY